MPISTPRAARLAAFIGVPVALVVSGVLVSAASYSAFSATTTNPTSNWTAGTVALTDDDANAALFTATNLKPGSTASNCIKVTSTGSLPSNVVLYGAGGTPGTALGSALNLTIEQGTGGGFGSCTGFTADATNGTAYTGTLAAFGSGRTSFATGVGSWTTTGAASESKVYRITYSLPTGAANTLQSATASIGFTWEAQNN
ncbi:MULTISPECIES: hypothetical protein [unclassified Frigoribacterium]|jgi:hypothetical protein|uniref:hypothetical protein n=1 Tax=unclassified Frigoribacterium TaxID=2627005 RepID=UPI0006F55EE0|nr:MULTISPECIES: hypothetical protein [unclassified Frigoribacterium]KQS18009.1 hypothetical protein ASG05_15090 [Frigoribacterium sp. Leaf186]MBF4600524.1 hypothetical protein [Frigoribacterium sp. VKM Ac-1396]